MHFVPVALLLLFAATFVSIWLAERARGHLLWFAACFGTAGAAVLVQVGQLPKDLGQNAVISALFYVAATLMLAEGVLARSRRRLPPGFKLAALIGITAAVGWFFYVDRDLRARIYILNFGMGAVLLYAAWHARFLRLGSSADRVLFWVLLILALHFFPRTLLTGNVDGSVSGPERFFGLTFWGWIHISLSTLGAAMGIGLLVVTGIDVIDGLRRERDSDPMTGVLNRRGLKGAAGAIHSARRGSDRTCVVVCDIDHFKAINDEFGHAAGDAVLVGFARLLQKTARGSDVVARLGGEEFAVVLRECGGERAVAFAERLRQGVRDEAFPVLPPGRIVTCSFGVAEFRPGETLWEVLDRADQNLYAAKRGGRNRTVADGLQPAG
jgi:diguanylate cyclase (GGDEF)-like protein